MSRRKNKLLRASCLGKVWKQYYVLLMDIHKCSEIFFLKKDTSGTSRQGKKREWFWGRGVHSPVL